MPPAPSAAAIVIQIRLWSGIVLFTYLTTHFLNHALGLVSLDAMEAGRDWFVLLWRSWPGTVALYGSYALPIAAGDRARDVGDERACRQANISGAND